MRKRMLLSSLLCIVVALSFAFCLNGCRKKTPPPSLESEAQIAIQSISGVKSISMDESAHIIFVIVSSDTEQLDLSELPHPTSNLFMYSDEELLNPISDVLVLGSGDNFFYLKFIRKSEKLVYNLVVKREIHDVHEYGEWEILTPATCTSLGTKRRSCSCGANETETIPLINHEYTVTVKAPTCLEGGYTKSACVVCGDIIISDYTDPLGHNIIHHDAQEPTCLEFGWMAYDHCDRCDYSTYKEIPAYGHDFLPHEAKAPTCVDIGWEAYTTCSRCDYNTRVTIPAKGHSWDDGLLALRPSIETEGIVKTTCTTCSESYSTPVARLTPSEGLSYESIEDIYCVIKGIGTCKDTELVIPSHLDGIAVQEIKMEAFKNCSQLTSVVIPNTVTKVEYSAFIGCSSLETVIIGSDVTHIGYKAFLCATDESPSNLTSFINWNDQNSTFTVIDGNLYKDDGKTLFQYAIGKEDPSFTLPYGVDLIDAYAFSLGKNLKNVFLPNGVTFIEKEAFFRCPSLETISIPDSVLSVGENAFFGCDSLTVSEDAFACYLGNENNPYLVTYRLKNKDHKQITTNPNTKILYSYCFEECPSLKSVTLGDSVIFIGCGALRNCTALESLDIPSSVLRIDAAAFEYCRSLSSVNIGSNVMEMNESVFRDCSALTSVIIPKSLKAVPSYAFYNCNSLTSIQFHDSFVKIGEYAFYSCVGLDLIVLPASLQQIEDGAFLACDSHMRVYYEGERSDWLRVRIESQNECISENDIYFYSTVIPENDTYSYWHYDSNDEIEHWQVTLKLVGNGYLFDTQEDVIGITVRQNDDTVYGFTPTTSGIVTIRSKGTVDTKGILYDSNMVLLDVDDDSDVDGNFKITHEVTAGEKYYINVTPYSSGYFGNSTVYIVLEGCGASFPVKRDFLITYPMKQSIYLLPNLESEGKEFLGWFSNEECTIPVDNNHTITKTTETLYAGWPEKE